MNKDYAHSMQDDRISRQAVIELIKGSYYDLAGSMDDVWSMVADVEGLPSVTVDKEYLIDLIQEAVYDGEACAKLIDMVDRPKNMIHIDEVYRLIAGHSNYHGDSILSAFTCLVEGKDVKPIAPLDESAEPKTGECKDCIHWDKLDYEAPRQGWCDQFEDWTDADEYCSRCAKMRGEEE